MGRDFKKLTEVCKERWLRFEEQAIAFGASKGWTWTEIQVRFAGGLAAFAILVLLYEIF